MRVPVKDGAAAKKLFDGMGAVISIFLPELSMQQESTPHGTLIVLDGKGPLGGLHAALLFGKASVVVAPNRDLARKTADITNVKSSPSKTNNALIHLVSAIGKQANAWPEPTAILKGEASIQPRRIQFRGEW